MDVITQAGITIGDQERGREGERERGRGREREDEIGREKEIEREGER